MGFAAAAMEKRATMGPSIHPSRLDDPRFIFGSGYGEDATGLDLCDEEVLGWPALLQALRMISWGIGMMPCHLYEKQGEGRGKLRQADEHPLHWLLHDEPHPEYTPFEFNSCMAFRAAFQGDAYAQIVRARGGKIDRLFPLDTNRMTAKRVNGKLYFEYREDGGAGKRPFADEEILHIKGFNDGGILGYALNQISRTTLAKGVGMDRYGARVFKSGVTSGAVIEMAQPFTFKTDDEKKKFYDKIQDSLSGERNWHKVIGLPYGMTMKNLGISPKDAQLIEGLTYQVQDIARLTGVPPSLLMELSRSTFTNSEQQMLQFIQLCLGPWIVNIEQRYKKSLLSMEERKRFVIKFLVDALLRTDLKTQNDALRVAVGQPWMSVNEARDLKELSPLAGEQYSEVALPLNMANPGGDPGVSAPDATPPASDQTPPQDGDPSTGQRGASEVRSLESGGKEKRVAESRRAELRANNATRIRLRNAYKKTITREAGRLVKAEIREIRKLIEKAGVTQPDAPAQRADSQELASLISEWYAGGGFASTFDRILAPVLRDYADAMADAAAHQVGKTAPDLSSFVDEYLKRIAGNIAGGHNGQMAQIISEADADGLYDALSQRLDEWDAGREDGERMSQGEKIGSRFGVDLGEAVASAAWKAAGFSALVWLASSNACPICNEIDGKVVGIDEVFMEASDEIDPADDTLPVFKSNKSVSNPPLHGGCECEIAPE